MILTSRHVTSRLSSCPHRVCRQNNTRLVARGPDINLERKEQRIPVFPSSGIRKIEKLSETKAFGRIGARLWEKHHPGCKEHRLGSDEYWRCYIRHNTLTNYHPVSTCRMGEGPGTVVDSELRSDIVVVFWIFYFRVTRRPNVIEQQVFLQVL